MGYFLPYEGTLNSVIAARDKYLSTGVLILPNDCFMHLFAIFDEDRCAKQDRERPPGGRFAGTWDIPGDLSSGVAPEELSRRFISIKPKNHIKDRHIRPHKCNICEKGFG